MVESYIQKKNQKSTTITNNVLQDFSPGQSICPLLKKGNRLRTVFHCVATSSGSLLKHTSNSPIIAQLGQDGIYETGHRCLPVRQILQMASEQYCHVDVTWLVEGGGAIEDVVIYNIESGNEESPIPSNSLDRLADLYLVPCSPDPEPVDCTARVLCGRPAAHLAIAAIDILSDVRKIEVASSTGEYLVTAEGTKLDVAGERKLFLSQHTFAEAQSNCSLKFVSLAESKRIWLHSLHITLAVRKPSFADLPAVAGPIIDMDKVNAMMAEMDSPIPDHAKGLMKAMTNIQKNKQQTMGNFGSLLSGGGGGPPTMAGMIGMFASLGLNTNSQTTSSSTTTPKQTPPVTVFKKAEPEKNCTMKKKSKRKKSGKKSQTPAQEKEKDPPIQQTQQNGRRKGGGGGDRQQDKSPPPLSAETKSKTDHEVRSSVDLTRPVTQGDLFALQQRLEEQIRLSEENVVHEMTSRLAASEQRIMQHMDSLVSKMAAIMFSNTTRTVNGASVQNEMNLD